MTIVYIALGSNLGDRRKNLEDALVMLARDQIEIVKRSSVYETAPRDVLDQPWFLNMVVACRTPYFPSTLIARLMRIEKALGRSRGKTARAKGPRTIDLDILLFGNQVIDSPELIVPHPRMLQRRFVLEPLLEIEPGLRHPLTKEPMARSLAALLDQESRSSIRR